MIHHQRKPAVATDGPSTPAASQPVRIASRYAETAQAGIPLTDRLSIVGFDEIDIAAFPPPVLITVGQNCVEMYGTAAGART